jgi:dehydrogenase/reductase SDR family member 12
MNWTAKAVDGLLEVTVAGSFSRLGLSVRSRLLAEFTADNRPTFSGRTAIVTGATSGLGLATATELARRHGVVHILARDPARADRARQQIVDATGNGSVSCGIADLTDVRSLREFASKFAAQHDRLDVLVHNAGAMNPSYQVNDAGIELTFAGHVVGPFALTTLLLPQLLRAAPSRVIAVSSGGMYAQPLCRSLTPMDPDSFRAVTAYARAKRAQVALSAEWARRMPATDIAFHAMHPGWADTPGVARSLPAFRRLARPVLRTPEQGADTIIWLATASPAVLGSGLFWHDRRSRPEYLLQGARTRQQTLARQSWDSLAVMIRQAADPDVTERA